MADPSAFLGAGVRRWAAAWLVLTIAFGLHVVDEASHDFLGWYNPLVSGFRDRFGWVPMPTFRFDVWLAGLIAAVVLLAALTPQVARGRRWLIPIAYVYAGLHIVNGAVHLAASAYERRLIPGVLSAPLLLGAGAWLFVETMRMRRALTASEAGDRRDG